ncbi:MAG: GIY-YIG nuclease family protein [Rickettsiales bacterium]
MTKPGIGNIYVLSNPAMPGMVKVGFTEKGEVQRRANELSSSSSVPLPFSIEHEVLVEDPRKFEALIHKKLKRFRVSPDREFFQIDVEEAIRDVDKVIFGTDDAGEIFKKSLQMLVELHDKYPERFFDRGENTIEKVRAVLDGHFKST